MALLIGDATTTYSIADADAASQITAALFTAATTGTVDQLQFRTNGIANTGVTSLILGIYADNGSGTAPANAIALGQGTFSGTPGTNAWIIVSGLSIAVVSGTKYWLAFLPIGGTINYNEAVASGGTSLVATGTGFASLSATSTWGAVFANGPIGFQGLSTVVVVAPIGLPLSVGNYHYQQNR